MHGENTEQYQRAIKLLSLTHEDNRQILQKPTFIRLRGVMMKPCNYMMIFTKARPR